MENRKATKRALLTSITALVMCVVMLVGTTFAWFTDTASTGVNKIQAGNLDVQLMMATAWDADGNPTGWANAEGGTLSFLQKQANGTVTQNANILWEPGCTYELPELKVVNNGNLALKYEIAITGAVDADGDDNLDSMKLLNVLKFKSVVGSDTKENAYGQTIATGTLNTNGAKQIIKLSAKMDENAGNGYMNMALSNITVTVKAAQASYEYDSNGKTYDENASYPVTTTEELTAALMSKETIVLGNDITITTDTLTANNLKQTLDFNGHKLILDGEDEFDYGCLDVYGELTLVDSVGDGGIIGKFYDGFDKVPTAVFINDGAVVNLESGTIKNVYRGVANYYSGGTFNMTGGKIAVKQASEIESAGVFFHRGGTVNLNGGEISGAIYFEKTATSQPSYAIGAGFTNTNNSVFNTSGVTATQNEDGIWISTIM